MKRHLHRVQCLVIALVAAAGLANPVCANAQPASSQPFPMVEAGMHTTTIWRIAVDAAGRFAVSASADKTARVWDLTDGKLLRVLRVPVGSGDEGKLYAVAMSPDGRLIALGGFTGPAGAEISIYLFERGSGRMLGRIAGLPQVVLHLAFSRDGTHLAAALHSGGVRVFAATAPWAEQARDTDYQGGSYSVEFDARGRLVASSYDGKLRLYDAAFRRVAVRAVTGGSEPFFARFSPDGARIAVGFNDSTALTVVSGEDLRFLYAVDTHAADNGDLGSVAWSADGETLHAAGRNQQGDGQCLVRAWSRQGRGPMQAWPVSTDDVLDLQALPDGRLVFAAVDPAWGVLDARGQMLVKQSPPILDHRATFDRFRLSASADVVEFAEKTWQGTAWRQRLLRFDVAARSLQREATSRAGLAAPRTDGLPVREWRNTTKPGLGEQRLKLFNQYETSRSLAVSSDAKRFALGTEWHVYLFDARGERLWRTPVPDVAWGVNLSADGRFVVAIVGDGTLRWYRSSDGSEALALFVHADGQRWVLWTPEGFYDAAPGADDLIGYHLNRGHDQEGEFVGSAQLTRQFFRPDLIAKRLAGDERVIAQAVSELGDVRQVLAAGLAPQLELLSAPQAESEGDYELRVRITERSAGTGAVEFRINGQEVPGRATAPTGDMLTQRFSLAPGRNVISTSVYSRDGKLASKPVETVVIVSPSADKPTLHVLAVGITGYRDRALAKGVRFAAGDAKSIARTLQERAPAEVAQVATPVVLTEQDATRARIVAELQGLATRVKPADLFVLYLAGHGTSLDDGEYYFVPWEVRFTSEAALKQQALSGPQLRELLKPIRSTKTVVVLDTCSSGSFNLDTRGRDLGDKSAVDRFARLSGRALLAAAGDQRMALESPDNEHGIFTGVLIRGLEGAANTNHGPVNIGELGAYVEAEVPRITQQMFGYEQFPMHDSRGQNFPVSRGGR